MVEHSNTLGDEK